MISELNKFKDPYDVSTAMNLEVSNKTYADIDKFMKTHTSINELTSRIFLERYNISHIGINNLEEVFNPAKIGIYSLVDIKDHLVEKGMSAHVAQKIGERYLSKLEDKVRGGVAHQCRIMDFFDIKKDHSKSLNALISNDLNNVAINYQSIHEFRDSITK